MIALHTCQSSLARRGNITLLNLRAVAVLAMLPCELGGWGGFAYSVLRENLSGGSRR